jgi:hypothetical protein
MDYANEIKLLMSNVTQPCISMYLPLSVGNESVQAKITLKSLLREAETKLLQTMRRPDVEELLSPMESFLLESRSWEKRGNGLAVFIAPGFFRHVHAPIEFSRRLMIGETFHIKPMLQLLNNPGDYYVLDLDLGKTRVFYGTEFTLQEIELQGTPLSLEEAMQYDDPENHLQFHTSTPSRGGEGGRRAAQFHGHGGTTDYEKNNILRYFQQLDVGLQNVVATSGAPVVLGGAEYLTAIYREASKYSGPKSWPAASATPNRLRSDTPPGRLPRPTTARWRRRPEPDTPNCWGRVWLRTIPRRYSWAAIMVA